jgi:hypothetical protein
LRAGPGLLEVRRTGGWGGGGRRSWGPIPRIHHKLIFAFTDEASTSLLFDAEQALAFQPREEIVKAVRENAGLDLCGARASCPGGTGS